VPAATSGARSEVSLKGQWEIARDDELLPKEIAVPIRSLPQNPLWKSIAVPSDKAVSRPELTLAHRVWYRTRVEVPADMAGRSFFINFTKNNLNTTVMSTGSCVDLKSSRLLTSMSMSPKRLSRASMRSWSVFVMLVWLQL
jgi:hypothetical protein